jgi:hypothetical protein
LFLPAANTLGLGTNSAEKVRVTSDGYLLVGTTYGSGVNIIGTNPYLLVNRNMMAFRDTVNASGPSVGLLKTRASLGTFGIVSNGDTLGQINFAGDNGVDYSSQGAQIVASVDGVPSSTSMAGRLVFSTTPSASITPQERVRIDSSGNVGIGTSSPAYKLQVANSSTDVNTAITGSGIVVGSGFAFREKGASNGIGGSQFPVQIMAAPSYGNIEIFHTGPNYGIVFGVNSTEKARIDNSGRLLVGLTSANASGSNFQVSQGVTFPATQSASTDANTLDDYEEGTFTPTIRGETTAGTTTYSAQTGAYTKVGRQVTITLTLNYSALTGTGNYLIQGLPFSNNATYEAVGSIMSSGLNWSGGTQLTPYFPASSSSLYLYGIGDDIGQVVQQCFDESASMRITLTHFV